MTLGDNNKICGPYETLLFICCRPYELLLFFLLGIGIIIFYDMTYEILLLVFGLTIIINNSSL